MEAPKLTNDKSRVFFLVTDERDVKFFRSVDVDHMIKPEDDSIVWKLVSYISKGKVELFQNSWKTLEDLILFISDQIQSVGINSCYNMRPLGEEKDQMFLKYVGKSDQLYYYLQYSDQTGKARLIVYSMVKPGDQIRFDQLSLKEINAKFEPLFRKAMFAAVDSEDYEIKDIIDVIKEKITFKEQGYYLLKEDALDICKRLFPLETEECHPKLCQIFLAYVNKTVYGVTSV